VLALSRGLLDYLEAQRQRHWALQARQHPCIYLDEATALIVSGGALVMRPPGAALCWG